MRSGHEVVSCGIVLSEHLLEGGIVGEREVVEEVAAFVDGFEARECVDGGEIVSWEEGWIDDVRLWRG